MSGELRNQLIDWLNSQEDPFDQLGNLGIKVSTDSRYPNLFNLKYGCIDVDKADPIVCACRGAIVERCPITGKFSLVAYAFDRFFNVGEPYCHNLDWGKVKVLEKYDGSLLVMYFYGGQWLVSTSGSVAAGSEVGYTGRTFAELFWAVFNQVGYSEENLNQSLCYIFELCHRDNRVVVDYPEPQLPLLAVRDRECNFNELPLEQFAAKFNVAQSYGIKSVEATLQFAKSRGADHEGLILFDGEGRAKVKSGLYCQLHLALNNGFPSFSKLFLSDNLEEFLLYFPQFKEKFDPILEKVREFGKATEEFVVENGELPQKEFALKVMEKLPHLSAPCFAIRSGTFRNFAEWVETRTYQQLDRFLSI